RRLDTGVNVDRLHRQTGGKKSEVACLPPSAHVEHASRDVQARKMLVLKHAKHRLSPEGSADMPPAREAGLRWVDEGVVHAGSRRRSVSRFLSARRSAANVKVPPPCGRGPRRISPRRALPFPSSPAR